MKMRKFSIASSIFISSSIIFPSPLYLTKMGAMAQAVPCQGANLMIFEGHLKRVLNSVPLLEGGPVCKKGEYSSDMISAARLSPEINLPGVHFRDAVEAEEVPLEFLFENWLNIFDGISPEDLTIAIQYDSVGRASVSLIKLRSGAVFILISDAM
ncbi:hypothetical protein JMK10_07975 [Rhodovulum sulfidophilum]|uniref:hypothetical protein n=1 Tax=Rhodovulum sulfidophilum TaxID=35806 RepID=UPI001924CE2B|nr:hypothetical protein [Rhodovulum sulfidophilum]MBL3576290.1 hypothetical protein [Rhodovulum sulfidophilum]MCE8433754.1 hypothetical protein [Rhodovulum sulfidophilum]MCF4116744.1 hypothetical protein [Rhodovulum sulfidophilum]